MSAPIAAFMYGAARFFWEFFRYYKPGERNYLFGLSLWQLFGVLIMLVTFIWAAVLYKTQPSEPLPKHYLRKKKSNKNIIHNKRNKRGKKRKR